jgi:hypothetical protein
MQLRPSLYNTVKRQREGQKLSRHALAKRRTVPATCLKNLKKTGYNVSMPVFIVMATHW